MLLAFLIFSVSIALGIAARIPQGFWGSEKIALNSQYLVYKTISLSFARGGAYKR